MARVAGLGVSNVILTAMTVGLESNAGVLTGRAVAAARTLGVQVAVVCETAADVAVGARAYVEHVPLLAASLVA